MRVNIFISESWKHFFRVIMGHVTANVEVIGTKDGFTMGGVLVDTGASFTVLPVDVVEKIGGLKLPVKPVNLELRDELIIEAIGETPTRSRMGQDIIIFLGTIVKRVREGATERHYGIAIPENFMRFLKDFEVGGFQALKLHLFIVLEFGLVWHLGPQMTVELVKKLRVGETPLLSLMDINYKPTKD